MQFFRHIITLLVVSLALSGFAAPAVAQADNATDSPIDITVPSSADNCASPEAIDNHTAICSASLEDGQAVLRLWSDTNQRITLSDAGALFEGGEIRTSRSTLLANQTTTARVPATISSGNAAVAIETGAGTLYGVPVKRSNTVLSAQVTQQDVTWASAASALSVALVSCIVVIRAVAGYSDSPERVA